MNFEDSRNAIYCDPNAFIQSFHKEVKCEHKKVVFQEPYESLPAFYINNDFKKKNCECVPKSPKAFDCNNGNFDNHKNCTCDKGKSDLRHDDNCYHNGSEKQNKFEFDLKSLIPLLGAFNNGGGSDLNRVVGLLNNNSKNSSSSNLMTTISNLFSSGGLGGILNLFKGSQKTPQVKKELKTTDFEIKNYTRVD